jgi:hypothetical protein
MKLKLHHESLSSRVLRFTGNGAGLTPDAGT